MKPYNPQPLDIVKYSMGTMNEIYGIVIKSEGDRVTLLQDNGYYFEEELKPTKVNHPDEIKEIPGESYGAWKRRNFKTLATKIMGLEKTLEEWAPIIGAHELS